VELTAADRLTDAANVYALELAEAAHRPSGVFGRIDLPRVRCDLAAIGEGRPEVFEEARGRLAAGGFPRAVELVDGAALWAAFVSDD
jgi:hypothetical protein